MAWSDVCAHGLRRHAQTQVRRGRWRRPAPGVLVLHDQDLTEVQRQRVAVLHAGPTGLLAGEAGLLSAGLRSWEPSRLDVVSVRFTHPLPWVTYHRPQHLPVPASLLPVPRVGVATAAVQAAQWARSDSQAATLLRMVLQQRLASPRAVLAASETVRGRRQLVRDVVDDALGGATTRAEAVLRRAWAARPGLPPLRMQIPFTQVDGTRRFFDAGLCPDDVPGLTRTVVLELEGLGHLTPTTADDDCVKEGEAALAGVVVVHVPNHRVLEDPDAVIDLLLAVARRHGAVLR